jgi:hypothetical protein
VNGRGDELKAMAMTNPMKEQKAQDRNLSDAQEQEYVRRSIVDWFKCGGIDIPSNSSSVQEYKDRYYVELHDADGTLAVYRIHNGGILKALKRWPPEVECTLEAMHKVEAKAKKRKLAL